MGLRYSIPLPGPFRISGPVLRHRKPAPKPRLTVIPRGLGHPAILMTANEIRALEGTLRAEGHAVEQFRSWTFTQQLRYLRDHLNVSYRLG